MRRCRLVRPGLDSKERVKVRHLYISPGHNFFGHHGKPPDAHPLVEVAEIECVAGRGIQGDRFFDFKENYKGQISFFSMEVFKALCAELDLSGKSPGLSRRNVIVEGADLSSWYKPASLNFRRCVSARVRTARRATG